MESLPNSVSRLPWGGMHVIMLGDPTQLPAVGRSDLFGRRTFSVLVFERSKVPGSCAD